MSRIPRYQTEVYARAVEVGGVDAGECEQFQFTWPSDVDNFKAQLDTIFDDTDASVADCPALPALERAAWRRFFGEWKTFRAEKTPTFGSSNKREQACAFSRRLDAERAKIQKFCTIIGPEQIAGGGTGAIDLVKWGVIGVAVVGSVVVLAMYAPEIKIGVRGLLGSGKR